MWRLFIFYQDFAPTELIQFINTKYAKVSISFWRETKCRAKKERLFVFVNGIIK